MLRKNRAANSGRQAGVVSLIVVSILTVVIALVAVGFSKLMDREVRQSLDNELSTQAYYSALAGLNDARAYLAAGGGALTGCSDWKTAPLGTSYFSSDLSGGSNLAKYSCVSINTTPNELIYTINPGQSVTFGVNLASFSQAVDKLYIGWEKTSYQTGPRPLGAFTSLPQQSGLPADATGLLRVGLYPSPGSGQTTNAALTNLSRTYFMYPDPGSAAGQFGSVGYASNNGNFVHGDCFANNTNPINNPEAAARYCNSAITGLSGLTSAGDNIVYVHLTAQYTPLVVTIQATTSASNFVASPLSFNNVQAVVDVTGQGTDVLQRIRARIDLSNAYQTPDYGVQSMVAVCKGYEINVPTQGQYGGSTVDTYNGDSACATPGYGGSIATSPSDQPPHNGLPGPAPPPSAAVNMVGISHDYNNGKGNGELWLSGTVNDAGASGTTAWFDSVTCDPSGTGFGAFPTAKQSIPADNNTHTISAYIFPWTFYYCGYHSPMVFVICANNPLAGTTCSTAQSTYPPL